jgi:hypothetical protein
MKNIKTLQEQIQKVVKETQKSSNVEKQEQGLEFIDFNKSIEKMLTAKSSEDKAKNVLNV